MRLLKPRAWLAAGVALAPTPAQPADLAGQRMEKTPSVVTSSGSGLEDIIVTARRRRENNQDVPISISALSQEQLARQNVVSVADLQARIPSLQARQLHASRDQIGFRIRGQGQAISGTLPAVLVYFADVPTNAAGNGLLFDLESVQVLKGPQGTLFGRNSTGGAVLINPARPGPDFGGFLEATVGNLNAIRVQGAINAPLVADKVLFRLAVDSNTRDGFTRNMTNNVMLDDRDYLSWRASLVIKPMEGLENYFVYGETNSKTHGGSLVPVRLRPGSLAATQFPGTPAIYAAQAARGIRTIEQSLPINLDQFDSRSATNVLTYEISDNVTFKNILGYRMFRQRMSQDTDATPFPFIEQHYISNYLSGGFSEPRSHKAYSAEAQLQFKAAGGHINGVVGVYADWIKPYSRDDQDLYIQFGNKTDIKSLRDDRSKAVFGQVSADLSSLIRGLSVTAGGRYTEDSRKLELLNITNGVCTTILADANCFRTLNAQWSQFTYTVSAEYRLAAQTLVYLASRKGYKSGGFNQAVAVGGFASFNPETVVDYELGLKSDFRLGSVPARLNIAAFSGNYDDIQRGTVQVSMGQSFNATTNVGKARIKGVEIEYTIRPVPPLSLSGYYAYTHAKYLTPALRAIPFQNTPKHKAGLIGAYTIESSEGDIVPSFNLSYISSFHASNAPGPFDIQKGYALVDARIDWNRIMGTRLNLYAFVSNLTDKEYVTGMVNTYESLGYITAAYSEPRTYGMGARINF